MKSIFAILVVVFCGLGGVQAFFGLPVEIPYLKGTLDGVWSFIPSEDIYLDADLINYVEQYDKLGVVIKVPPSIRAVRSTVLSIFTEIYNGVVNTSGDTDQLFRQLKEHLQNAVPVVSDAKSSIASLSDTLISADMISVLFKDTFEAIFMHIGDLLTQVNTYEAVATEIRASAVPITSQNIAGIVNEYPTLTDEGPFLSLAGDLGNLNNQYAALLVSRSIAIVQQQQTNQTIEQKVSNFPAFVTEVLANINKAADDVTTQLKQHAEIQLLILQSTFNYTSILDPDYYNGNQTITDYFANVTTIIKNCYELYLPQLTSNLENETAIMLQDQKQPSIDLIFEAVRIIIDSGSLSSNPNANHCVDQITSQILQSTTVADRLRICLKSEPSLIAEIYQEAKTSLDAIIDYVLLQQESFSVCSSSSGACFNKFVKQLPKYVHKRLEPYVAGALRRIAKKLHLSRSRMQFCTQVVQADMQDFFDQLKVTYQTCLLQ